MREKILSALAWLMSLLLAASVGYALGASGL
jgi:hypothetical protein